MLYRRKRSWALAGGSRLSCPAHACSAPKSEPQMEPWIPPAPHVSGASAQLTLPVPLQLSRGQDTEGKQP